MATIASAERLRGAFRILFRKDCFPRSTPAEHSGFKGSLTHRPLVTCKRVEPIRHQAAHEKVLAHGLFRMCTEPLAQLQRLDNRTAAAKPANISSGRHARHLGDPKVSMSQDVILH